MSGGTSDSYGVNTTGIMDTPITPAKRLVSQNAEPEALRRTPIRPLTAAYKAASNPHEVRTFLVDLIFKLLVYNDRPAAQS